MTMARSPFSAACASCRSSQENCVSLMPAFQAMALGARRGGQRRKLCLGLRPTGIAGRRRKGGDLIAVDHDQPDTIAQHVVIGRRHTEALVHIRQMLLADDEIVIARQQDQVVARARQHLQHGRQVFRTVIDEIAEHHDRIERFALEHINSLCDLRKAFRIVAVMNGIGRNGARIAGRR